MGLEALFRPGSIAVIDEFEKPTIVLGGQCSASIAESPEAPDVAVFCVGHECVLEPFAAAAELGVKAAVIAII
jgi:acyl-CoA synthetase (NDP forming)